MSGSWRESSGGLSTTVSIGLFALPPTSWLIQKQVPKDSINIGSIVDRFGNAVDRIKRRSPTGSVLDKELLAQILHEVLKITPLVFTYREGGGTWDHSTTDCTDF